MWQFSMLNVGHVHKAGLVGPGQDTSLISVLQCFVLLKQSELQELAIQCPGGREGRQLLTSVEIFLDVDKMMLHKTPVSEEEIRLQETSAKHHCIFNYQPF